MFFTLVFFGFAGYCAVRYLGLADKVRDYLSFRENTIAPRAEKPVRYLEK